MSLREAVSAIVEQMEGEPPDSSARHYAKFLRIALKASEAEVHPHAEPLRLATVGGAPPRPPAPLPGEITAVLETARQGTERARERDRAEEMLTPGMVYCEGGSSDGVLAPVASDMPIGARTLIGGEVYVLTRGEGKPPTLTYSEEATHKLRDR